MSVRLSTFAWRNLWRNARRTLVLISVFTLGIFTMLLIQSFLQGWIKSTFETTYKNLAEPIQIHQPAYIDNPEVEHFFAFDQRITDLLDKADIQYTQRIRIGATMQSEYDSVSVMVVGINPESEQRISFLNEAISQGQYPNFAPGLVVGEKLAKRLTTQLNRRVVLMTQKNGGGLAEIGLPIIGLYKHPDPRVEESLVFMPLPTAANWLNVGNGVHQIGIIPHTDNKAVIQALGAQLQSALPDLTVQTIWQRQPVLEATMELSDKMIWIWLGFVLLLMMLGMLNTLMMSLYERQQEFNLLYSLGIKPLRLRLLVTYEIVFIVLVSTALAISLMLGLVAWVGDGIELKRFAEGAAQFGMGTTLYLLIDIPKWTDVLVATLTTTLLFSLWPVWRATRHNRLQAR
ncbi:MAG: FtsX-like permease family protein [Thiomicrospira sp.]|jgi:ABC-type lipoprotein release transport system permease subunit|nr:FtsX-like permease family protein [Thiomicrospira sp.]